MQDIIQFAVADPDVSELFEGISAGSKVTLTLDVTVSEIDDERFVATIDEVHDNVKFDDLEIEDEEDYEEEGEEEEEEYEDDEDEEEEY